MTTAEPKNPCEQAAEGPRNSRSVQAIRKAILDNLICLQGKFPEVATKNDWYLALAYTVRDRLLSCWTRAARTYFKRASRTICYLSAEFLLGPQLGNNLVNLGIMEEVKEAVADLDQDLDAILEQEEEPGLGNGGLGRLAACYMDSLATLNIPAIGYGIRYEFGIFDQEIRGGWQEEVTDKWLRYGNPWEIPRPEIAFNVRFGGYTKGAVDDQGIYRVSWVPDYVVKGVAYDTPIVGYRTPTASFLRLFKAEAVESFDFRSFNVGDYYGAVHEKVTSENLTKVLYPNDEPLAGKQLRLKQQILFVSCALQDMIRIYLQRETTLDHFHHKYAIQLNDTHPSIGVAELMRLLVDEYAYPWETAWEITRNTFCYTNHTLLPEALEKWPVSVFEALLPRHLEIIYEINARFLAEIQDRFPDDKGLVESLSLIDETGSRYVRMANLACVGSQAINGVAALHTELLKRNVLSSFNRIAPEKFSNKTNGITPRRFVVLANPGLTSLVSEMIGDEWILDPSALRSLERWANDGAFQEEWRAVKRANKERLAARIRERTGILIDPESLFDIQVKRIHEYKRQHLNALHVVTLYNRILRGETAGMAPRTVIIGGKAAPGYFMAKLIIKLINAIAETVNADRRVGDLLKVVFFPDFNVKNGQRIYPAADLSEQISTAGKEASGTGNMKFMLNGAVTIGTLDGANVEILEEVGDENFFLFGLTASEVAELQSNGHHPRSYYEQDPELREALEMIVSGAFTHGDQLLFRPLVDNLLYDDPFMALADYRSYLDCQGRVSDTYSDLKGWTRMAILNVARAGKFSSDRAIREYCEDIWKIDPVEIE
ncbi:MAG: glycogen/starch/alpha-glucan phosphorylase [Syntrophobacteraceae bacterium]